MRFISRLLFSWTFFPFLLIQHVNDSEVTKALLPFLPLILCVLATTFLVKDLILAQSLPHHTSETTSSSFVKWAKSSAPVTTGAPITTLAPLGVGVIDRPQTLTCSGTLRGYAPQALLVLAIFTALIAWVSSRHTVAQDRPASVSPPLIAKIRRFPSFSTVHPYSTAPLVSESQPTDFASPSIVPSVPSPKESENAATTATFHQALSLNQSPAPTPSSPVVDIPPSLPEPCQDGELHLPLLGWNFTSSVSEYEDDDDVFDDDNDDQLWWDTDDNQPIQIKEVPRGVVPLPSRVEGEAERAEPVAPTSTPAPTFGPGSRPLIPTGRLNLNIESLQTLPNQKFTDFSSSDDEKYEDTAPTSTLVPAVLGASRGRLRIPVENLETNLEVLQPRLAQETTPFPSREDGDDDDDDQAARQRGPSFTSALAPSRPLPPIPSPWRNPNVQRMQLRTPLFTYIEEEEEEEEDYPDQDRLPLSTLKPSRDAWTSSTSTTVESSVNVSGKPSAMKKMNGKRKMASERQDQAAPERVSGSSRLQNVLSKMSPRRLGKRFFKKKTGPF